MSIHLLNSDNVDDFLEQVSNATRLGIDTEFHAERRFTPLLLLIQIYVPGGDTWLIDPTRTLPHPEVASHLIEPEWIVHGGKFDLKLLNGFLGGLPKTVWDTQLGGG